MDDEYRIPYKKISTSARGRRAIKFVEAVLPARPNRKCPLPVGAQWVTHDKVGGRAAQRRLRQMGKVAGDA